jgi:hypothetical protein
MGMLMSKDKRDESTRTAGRSGERALTRSEEAGSVPLEPRPEARDDDEEDRPDTSPP